MKGIFSSNKVIKVTDIALKQIYTLRNLNSKDKLYLRISVKQGGCSGMSYLMDFELKENIRSTDEVVDYDNFQLICDNKSFLYLYGMSLDYTDSLIGGGFQFINPNAVQTCGCGKSFRV